MEQAAAGPGPSADAGSTEPSDDALVSAWGLVLEGVGSAGRVLARELEEAVGLPVTWVEVLFRLRRTPGQVLPTTQLAREVSFSSGGFTKLLDRLVEARLVARQACSTDRRIVYAALTVQGRAVADRALTTHVAGLRAHVLAAVGPERLQDLAEAMRRLRDHSRRADS